MTLIPVYVMYVSHGVTEAGFCDLLKQCFVIENIDFFSELLSFKIVRVKMKGYIPS